MWKINSLVYGAGIQTHNFQNIGLLPYPLVQGNGWKLAVRKICPFLRFLKVDLFQAIFRCSATANPPVYDYSYKWYIDDKLVTGQFGFYFKISNITRWGYVGMARLWIKNFYSWEL